MPNTIVVGAQWGDEGKGKIVDFLTEKATVVVRAQGGNNAGHTVISNGKKYVLHLMPSGILWPDKRNYVANGVVLDPIGLVEEIEKLHAQGVEITPQNLQISERAHLALPYHRRLDVLRELRLGDKKIGTTGRGIGPSYADKVQRSSFRAGDLRDVETFLSDYQARALAVTRECEAEGLEPIDIEETSRQLRKAAEVLTPYLGNTTVALNLAVKAGESLLFEGAQGTFLDIDHGTYPFVTSSNTTAGGAITGSGVSPRAIDCVVAVAKAYTTRVGSGPFVTEEDSIGDMLHNMGREFGATTGRARRCGWLDLVLLRYACMVNGADELAITNLDGLDGLDEIKVCVAYELDGQRIEYPPFTVAEFERAVPVYVTMKGWKQPIDGITDHRQLPPLAKEYLQLIEKETNTRISLLGVGPSREQTLIIDRS